MEPLVTPKKIHGNKKFPINCEIAFMCFCPEIELFKQYKIECAHKYRYFLHIQNNNILFCTYIVIFLLLLFLNVMENL